MAKDDLDAAWEGNLSVMDINYYKQYEPLFGSWRITRQIGEGSFGKVFEIEREDFGVTYRAALKAITVPASESELLEVKADGMDDASVRTYFGSFVEELVREFALMSRLKGNSNVVSYEDHQVIEHPDDIGWDILIRMELLTPLNRYTSTHTVTRQDVIKLGIDLCRALEMCQKFNIIHRDIKPENIFISGMGDFKLGDFGIARTVEKTTSGLSKKGTYTYMAPEVYKGEAYGSTVDIYSLGIVLYRLLNGNRTPFLPAAPAPITHADRENALARRFSGAPLPAPCHAEGRLAEIVLKACAYDQKERYSSTMQMRQELESILYNREESKYIYPEGDDVPQDSVHYVKTGEEPPVAETEATQRDSEAAQRNSGANAADTEDEGRTVSDFDGITGGFDRTTGEDGKTVSDFGGTAGRTSGMAEDTGKTGGNFIDSVGRPGHAAAVLEGTAKWADWVILLAALISLYIAAPRRVITGIFMYGGLSRLPLSMYVLSVVFSVLLTGCSLYISAAGKRLAQAAGLVMAAGSLLLGWAGMQIPFIYYRVDALFIRYGFETQAGLSFLQRFGIVFLVFMGIAWLLKNEREDSSAYRNKTMLLSIMPVCLLFVADAFTQLTPIFIGCVSFLYLIVWGIVLKAGVQNPRRKSFIWTGIALSIVLFLWYASQFFIWTGFGSTFYLWITVISLTVHTAGSMGVFLGLYSINRKKEK